MQPQHDIKPAIVCSRIAAAHYSWFYVVLPMSVFIYNKNNDKQRHTTSRITKEPKQKSRLGTVNNKITAAGGGGGEQGGG